MLVVGLSCLLLHSAPAVPPAVPLVSWQSFGDGPVSVCQLQRGLQKGCFAKAGYSLS
jgi:hypothetical protein